MDSEGGVVEPDRLERGLLLESGSEDEDYDANDDETVLYSASFAEMEENFIKFQTAQWALYSLLLMLAWGIGLFMLLYLPVRRYVLRKDIRSRKLYVTPNAIVYKVTRPVPFPCFGVLKKEKYVLLPSVADVVIEQDIGVKVNYIPAMMGFNLKSQPLTRKTGCNFKILLCPIFLGSWWLGYLQSLFGVYSIRIENNCLRRPPSDDVHIEGVANPHAFRKAVLTRLSNMRSETFSRLASTVEDISNLRTSHLLAALTSPSKSPSQGCSHHDLMILQKLEEVGSSVKRIHTSIEEQHSQKPGAID